MEKEPIKLEFKEDKILNIFMRVATREDIAGVKIRCLLVCPHYAMKCLL